MDFGKALLGESIPLAEASEFFINFKTAGWQDPPDETGELEGSFAMPVEQVLALLKNQAECELRCMVACHIYSASARGPGAQELEEELRRLSFFHRDLSEYLMRRMAVLGGPVHIDQVEPPPASSTVPDIVTRMIRAEQECLAGWNELAAATCGNPMEDRCKKNAASLQASVDCLWKLVPHTVSSPLLGPPAEGAEGAGGEEPPVGMRGELPPGMEHDEAAEDPAAEASEPPEVQAAEEAAGIEMHPPAEKKPAPKKEPSEEKKPPAEKKEASDKSDADLREAGRQRAVTNLAAEAHREKGRRGERALETVGRAAGGIGGAVAGKKFLGGRLGAAAGLVGGIAAGGKAGKELGTEIDIKKNASVMRMDLALMKFANDPAQAAQMSAPSDGTEVASNYLAAEMAAQQAQEQNESGFYRGKLQEQLSQNEQMQQQIQSAQQQLQSLQMQASEAGSQIQAATDQAVQAQEEAMQQTLLAAKMRMGMQELRAQMLQIASQEPAAVAEEKQRQDAQAQAQALQQGLVDPAQAGPEAASAEAAPAAAAPDASGQAPATAPATSDSPMAQTAEPQAGLKAASAVLEQVKQRLPGALIGGGVGAGAAALSARRGAGGLRDKVQELEEMPGGGFRHSLNIARAKADLAQGEVAEKHPGMAALMGGLTGALAGGVAGPKIMAEGKKIPGKVKELVSRKAG